jgi:hypothetical protein
MLRTGLRSSAFVREIHVNFNPGGDMVLCYGCCELSRLESPAEFDLPAKIWRAGRHGRALEFLGITVAGRSACGRLPSPAFIFDRTTLNETADLEEAAVDNKGQPPRRFVR